METVETIGDAVEALARELEWTNEATALGDVDYGYEEDDSRGWLVLGDGLVRVTWERDPYGDGMDDWVAVSVEVSDEPYDADVYSHLSDAVLDAAHTTAAWQQYCDTNIRDGVVEWRASDERLPEDEADVHAMAREAYEWVKGAAE